MAIIKKAPLLLLCWCLFADAMGQLLVYNASVYKPQASKGYYFLFTFKKRKSEIVANGQQMILDGHGHLVYYRLTPRASDFKLQADGHMSFFSGGKFYLMNRNFAIVDSVGCVNGITTDPHDFVVLKNHHYLLLGLDSVPADLTGHAVFMQKRLSGARYGTIKAGVVQELNERKELVFEWRARQHFKLEDCDWTFFNDTNSVDITHFNSIDKDKDGRLLISARYLHEIFLLSPTGDFIWRFGGVHNEVRIVNDSIPFLGQHDARFLPNGHISLFDNGYGPLRLRHSVRAMEYAIDQKRKTASVIWQYSNDNKMISEAAGNAQWHKNGAVLVNYGRLSDESANVTFELVGRDKKKIMSLSFPDTIGTYRAFHYKHLPFSLHRPKLKKVRNHGKWYIQVRHATEKYQWNTGQFAREIAIDQPGTYYAVAPRGDGFLCSEPIIITRKNIRKHQ